MTHVGRLGAPERYLDFNDAYLAPGETCHPGDDVAPVPAACEYAGAGGRDFLAALAVASQVQCRLSGYGPEVNLFVDHSPIVQLGCLPRGIWGTKSLWGRVVTYPGDQP